MGEIIKMANWSRIFPTVSLMKEQDEMIEMAQKRMKELAKDPFYVPPIAMYNTKSYIVCEYCNTEYPEHIEHIRCISCGAPIRRTRVKIDSKFGHERNIIYANWSDKHLKPGRI